MHTLINVSGTTLIFAPFKGIESASAGVFFNAGSRGEVSSRKGIAHYLEHMLFKGSKKYSYRRIKREIEGRGGALNAFTAHELTGYYAHFLNKNLKPTLDILLDMVLNPLLSEEQIEKERGVILQEIKMYNDLPASRVGMMLDKLLWPRHPLGEEVVGYAATVKKIFRSDLVKFKDEFYRPANMVISCAGDFAAPKIIDLVEARIKKNTVKVDVKKDLPPRLRGRRIKIENRKLEQAHLCLGFRGVSYFSPDRFAVDLINVILGANMSSRLFEEVREKRGLCYDISTEARKYKDGGAFIVHLGLDKSKLNTALGSILRELRKIKEERVSLRELDRAKDYLLGQAAMALERPQGKMFFLAESFLSLGRIYSFEDIKKKIAAVSAPHIQRIARRMFGFSKMCVSSIGDFIPGQEDKIEEVIRKGDRHP